MSAAPRVLLLGGTGFIGRNCVKYILDFDLASKLRVVDKRLPSMSYLSENMKQLFERPNVEFVQANLTNPDHIQRAFNDPTGPYDIIINLAAETKYAQPEEIYQVYILQLRKLCADEAAKRQATRYIEVSTAQVYDGDGSTPVTENGKTKPWTTIAKYHLEAEKYLRTVPGLNYIIARLPVVYGPGDCSGLMARVISAAGYQYEEDKMQFLWSESLRMHTLHAQDAAAGIWYLVCGGGVGEVYNLVDDTDTTQGSFNKILEELFDIETSCVGTMLSLASTMTNFLTEVNVSHMESWQRLCAEYSIDNTPLSPYIDKELLQNNALSIDGSKAKALGFQLSCPNLTSLILRDTIEYWIQLKKFPPVLK